jgi:hypothetical protein
MQYMYPAIVGDQIINNCAGAIGRIIIDEKDLYAWVLCQDSVCQ